MINIMKKIKTIITSFIEERKRIKFNREMKRIESKENLESH
jgi:hypothetical protein